MHKRYFASARKGNGARAALTALAVFVGGFWMPSPGLAATAMTGKQTTERSKFYCNIKALSTDERTHHQVLTDKLTGARQKIVETPKGYEFQFAPSDISLAELADWVTVEGKCCLFFDFHIDLENEGSLICLRLTGEEGIKPFIRSEFQVPAE